MRLIRATKLHMEMAANDLCASDLQEFNCLIAGRDPHQVLTDALDENAQAIVVGSLVLAVGGHTDATVWFVTTNVIHMLTKAERMQFYRLLKENLAWVKQHSPGPKTNVVSVGNHAHIRLLTELGATFEEGLRMSPAGFAFKQFWI